MLRILLACILVLASDTYAEDCMVSTSPPTRLKSLADSRDTNDFSDTGILTISYANGDQVLARYGLCALSLNAHYLLRSAQQPSSELIGRFLTAVVPAEAEAKQLLEQLNATRLELNHAITLNGSNDSHTLELREASSPLFNFELHYRWTPPQH